VYTCVLCGTVFIPRIHIFGPGNEQILCPGDSVLSYKNILQKCVGSFDPGNEFIMEMSDANGLFGSPVYLGKKADTTVPIEIVGITPKKVNAGTSYKYRWRSTKPAIVGSFEAMRINPIPLASVYGSDSVFACKSSTLTLGNTHAIDTGITYTWTPSASVDTAKNARVKHVVTSAIKIKVSVFINNTGCKASDSAWIIPVTTPDPGKMQDTLDMCEGGYIQLGALSKGGYSYAWSPSVDLDDSTIAQPYYSGKASKKYTLKVTGNGGCFTNTSQYVRVNANPIGTLNKDSMFFNCKGETKQAWYSNKSAGSSVFWVTKFGDTLKKDTLPISNISTFWWGKYRGFLKNEKTGCASLQWLIVGGNAYYATGILKAGDTGLIETAARTKTRQWYRNDTLLADTTRNIYPKKSGIYKVCGISIYGCTTCSDTVTFAAKTQVNTVHAVSSNCIIYPNPAHSEIFIECQNITPSQKWEVQDATGRSVLSGIGARVSLQNLQTGIYWLQVGNAFYRIVRN
jgi:hypothetical protein